MAASGVFDPTANSFDNETALHWQQRQERRGPSKGCDNCRHRKIKCDERHPVCSRCHLRGLSCDYRDYSLVIFRDETSKVRQRVRAEQNERGDTAPTLGLAMPQQLRPSVQQTAIMRFFHDFVIDTPPLSDRNRGYFAPISDMYRRSKPHSSFALALSAAANANFWRRHKSFQARSNSLKDCGKALQQLRKDLQRCSRSYATASMLTASSLLATYQLVVSRDVSQRTSWTAHVHGAVALLDTEDPNDPETCRFAGLLQTVVSQMLIDCLIMGRHPTLPLQTAMSVMAPTSPPAALLVVMYRTAEVCATWKDKRSAEVSIDPAQQDLEIREFLEKSQILDEEVERSMQSRPEVEPVVILENTEQNVPAPLRALFASSGAPKTLHLYADIHQTHRRLFSRACQLTLLRTMIAAINTALGLTTNSAAPADYELIKAQVLSRAIRVVDNLLSTVFSSLRVSISGKAEPKSVADIQSFRGLQLLWPLHTAGTCLMIMGKHCSDGSEKLEWVRTLFCWIRDDLGIQTANNFLQVNMTRRLGNLP